MNSTLSLEEASVEPAPQRRATLFVMLASDQPYELGRRHALDGLKEAAIGRSATPRAERDGELLSLGLVDRHISTKHARLTRDGARWLIEDLGSKNGVRVNAAVVPRALLEDGDRIELGHTFLLFRHREEPADAAQEPEQHG